MKAQYRIELMAMIVTYMFRSIGQVLGVALSAAIVQAILSSDLQRSITGPRASEVCAHLAAFGKRLMLRVDYLHHPSLHLGDTQP